MTGDRDPQETGLEEIRFGVLRLFLYCVITLFIYYSWWFLRVGSRLNRLNSDRKVDVGLPIFVLTYAVLNVLVAIWSGFVAGAGLQGDAAHYAAAASKASDILGLAAGVVLLALTFRVRRILLDHFGDRVRISGVATFLLGIFYLQDKINKLPQREAT